MPDPDTIRAADRSAACERARTAIDEAFAAMPPRVLAAGTSLIPETPGVLHRLRRGWACRLYDWPDAARAIVEVYLPGDIIGLAPLLSGGPANPVVAATAVTIEAIDGRTASALLGQPGAVLRLARLLSEEQRRVARLAAAIARLEAPRRLAWMLLEFCERLGRGRAAVLSYHLPLTQQQIGDHLGLTLVHVNRVLRGLRQQGLIELNRHVVVIRDLEGLRRLVAGCRPEPGARSAGRLADRQVAHREIVAHGKDLGDPAAMADLPVGLVAD